MHITLSCGDILNEVWLKDKVLKVKIIDVQSVSLKLSLIPIPSL